MTVRISEREGRRIGLSKRSVAKYYNRSTTVDGVRFDSLAEAARYGELRQLEAAGWITKLKIHPRYVLCYDGGKVAIFVPDSEYEEKNTFGEWSRVVEDVKQSKTISRVFRLKARLFYLQYGITVRLVGYDSRKKRSYQLPPLRFNDVRLAKD